MEAPSTALGVTKTGGDKPRRYALESPYLETVYSPLFHHQLNRAQVESMFAFGVVK